MPKILPLDFTQTDYVGLAIATKTVSGMVIDGPNIRQAQSVADTAFLDATTVHQEILLPALKAIKQTLNLGPTQVAVSIPEKYAFSRTYVLPKINLSEIDEAVKWQVEKLFPYAQDEIYTDWRLISKSGSQAVIVVTAIPRTIINGIKDCLLASALFPACIEPSVTALARLVPGDKSPVVMAEIDFTSSSATIVDQGVPQVTATSFYGESAPVEVKTPIIAKSISDLVTHWRKDKPESTAVTVFLTGEAANQELVDNLTKLTKLPAALLPVQNIEASYHIAYAVATGVVKPPISEQSINLIPPGLQSYYQTAKLYQYLHSAIISAIFILSGGLILLLGGFFGIKFIGNYKLSQTASLTHQNVSTTSSVNLNLLTKNATRFKRLYEKKTTPELILSTVMSVIPKDTTLTSISYDPATRKIHLSGKALDREAIIKLREQLVETNLFKTADVPLSAYNTTATGNFSFELEVKKS